MLFSVITINRNNQDGLKKTMESVVAQSLQDFEYIVIDGASTDNSVDIIQQYENQANLNWVSEPDKGIYNAMNKGIAKAQGEYVMMLNSGDCLTSNCVLNDIAEQLIKTNKPDILYGNIIKVWPNGKKLRQQNKDGNFTMFSFYRGTLNHVGTCIRRELFNSIGLYNETMKICSDWEWFMYAVVFNNVKPVYIDIDTVYFDMTGISENGGQNHLLITNEKRSALQKALPPAILADYDFMGNEYPMLLRLHRHPWAYRLTHFLERCLFKLEKIKNRL